MFNITHMPFYELNGESNLGSKRVNALAIAT